MSKVELVGYAKYWYKHVSTWLIGAGTAVVGLAPDLHSLLVQIMGYWITLPDEIRAAMDISYIRYFGMAITILAIPAKYVVQKSLPQK